jgi:hypothetical protein
VLCLLPNTPWPWPTPARVANARGGFLPRSATEGERSEGLHKRSAEDEGAPCVRQERSSLGRIGFPTGARRYAQKNALAVAGGVGVAGRNGPAEVGRGERVSGRKQGGDFLPPN